MDFLAEGGKEVVVVEVKTTLRIGDVNEMVKKRIKIFRKHYLRLVIIYGAFSFLHASDNVSAYAKKRGLWLIRATNNTARIINTSDSKPRTFSI